MVEFLDFVMQKPWCKRDDMVMCPQCDKYCRFWVPEDFGCMMALVNSYMDNPIPVFVSGLFKSFNF